MLQGSACICLTARSCLAQFSLRAPIIVAEFIVPLTHSPPTKHHQTATPNSTTNIANTHNARPSLHHTTKQITPHAHAKQQQRYVTLFTAQP